MNIFLINLGLINPVIKGFMNETRITKARSTPYGGSPEYQKWCKKAKIGDVTTCW